MSGENSGHDHARSNIISGLNQIWTYLGTISSTSFNYHHSDATRVDFPYRESAMRKEASWDFNMTGVLNGHMLRVPGVFWYNCAVCIMIFTINTQMVMSSFWRNWYSKFWQLPMFIQSYIKWPYRFSEYNKSWCCLICIISLYTERRSLHLKWALVEWRPCLGSVGFVSSAPPREMNLLTRSFNVFDVSYCPI